MIRFYKTKSFQWKTKNTDRNGVNGQNSHKAPTVWTHQLQMGGGYGDFKIVNNGEGDLHINGCISHNGG